MDNFRLSRTKISFKLFTTALLCTIGLVYMLLLLNIWQDTKMKPSIIEQAYGTMEAIELAHNTSQHLPFYTIFLFAFPAGIFMFTSFPEKTKRILAVLPFVLIITDVSSMWMIPYVSKAFSWVLWFAGTCLAITFLTLFALNLYDIWLRKVPLPDNNMVA